MHLPANEPQYFFDDAWIAAQRHVARRWLPAAVYPDPAIVPDRPWEGTEITLFGTVVARSDGEYWMYYERRDEAKRGAILLATSRDELRWEKPELGLVEWGGNTRNNIVLAPERRMDSHSIAVDPDDAAYPYKMLASQYGASKPWGQYAYRSADGLVWEDRGLRFPSGDRANLMPERAEGKFVAYVRHPEMGKLGAGRVVHRAESDDFLRWTEPDLTLAADLDDAPDVEIYGMSAFRRNGWYFGLVEYWHGVPDVIETYLAVSRDGKRWHRPVPRAPFIARSYDWNRGWSTCASNGPIIVDGEMVFYFNGRWFAHGATLAERHGVIGRAVLPADHFCAIEGRNGGLDTPPFPWPGGDLVLNVDTRDHFDAHPGDPSGRMCVDVLDGAGEPVADWSGDRCATIVGNTRRGTPIVAKWSGDRSLDALRGREIMLRFRLERARLFTFAARTA